MNIEPSSVKEALDLIYNILNQGDSRYNDFWGENNLADFLVNKAVVIEQREMPQVEIPPDERTQLRYTTQVQWGEKAIAKALLKLNGFSSSEIYFERQFRGSRPDILAESDNRLVLVECCSCRINKIIDFLVEAEEVWVITRGVPIWENPISKEYLAEWFVFKKGPNWEKKINEFNKARLEELKKVKSPIDSLMGE